MTEAEIHELVGTIRALKEINGSPNFTEKLRSTLIRQLLDGMSAMICRAPPGSATPVVQPSSTERPRKAIVSLLKVNPGGLTGKEIADTLAGRFETSSRRPRDVLRNTLVNLCKNGKVVRHESGIYSLPVPATRSTPMHSVSVGIDVTPKTPEGDVVDGVLIFGGDSSIHSKRVYDRVPGSYGFSPDKPIGGDQ
jgi:hypothetical protein